MSLTQTGNEASIGHRGRAFGNLFGQYVKAPSEPGSKIHGKTGVKWTNSLPGWGVIMATQAQFGASAAITLLVMASAISNQPDGCVEFWNEYHLCTLTTLRPDGRPHVVPVGVTVDAAAGVARVITRKSSRKVANILAGGNAAPVAVCQVDGGRWATLEGVAEVCTDSASVDDAVARYGERYGRTPAPDPERVVIRISIERAMGQAPVPHPRASSNAAA